MSECVRDLSCLGLLTPPHRAGTKRVRWCLDGHCKGVFPLELWGTQIFEGLQKNCTGCVLPSSSLWLYFHFFFQYIFYFRSILSREEEEEEVSLNGVECPTIPNTWLLKCGCQRPPVAPDFTSLLLCDLTSKKTFFFPFMFFHQCCLACWGCTCEHLQASLYSKSLKCGFCPDTSVHLGGWMDGETEMQSPCLCICVNLCNVPMYIIL